jgi:hypothetical protein
MASGSEDCEDGTNLEEDANPPSSFDVSQGTDLVTRSLMEQDMAQSEQVTRYGRYPFLELRNVARHRISNLRFTPSPNTNALLQEASWRGALVRSFVKHIADMRSIPTGDISTAASAFYKTSPDIYEIAACLCLHIPDEAGDFFSSDLTTYSSERRPLESLPLTKIWPSDIECPH